MTVDRKNRLVRKGAMMLDDSTLTMSDLDLTAGLPKDWTLTDDGTYTRPLVGGEILMAWAHDMRKGGVSWLLRATRMFPNVQADLWWHLISSIIGSIHWWN